jgi:Sulfatase
MSNKENERPSTAKTGALNRRKILLAGSTLAAATALPVVAAVETAQAQTGQQPNIIVIMGDDIGWSNIGAYNQGIMAGGTPNLDRMASEGMRFTDYYAEASCTAGRANFITGELPIRTGLTTVGQAGATIGMPAQAPTIATVLKSMGYTDLPPLQWSSLRYVLTMEDEIDGEEAAYGRRGCREASAG